MIPAMRREAAREIDDVTLARAQRGEAAACHALVLHYQRPVFSLLGRMLFKSGRAAMVEDLAQETFLRAFRALPAFVASGPARLSTWILTIATRLALDELRRRGPEAASPISDGLADGLAAPTDGAADPVLEKTLARAIGGLSPEHRAVVLLREIHELDHEEIARVLEVDVGTVKSRLSRARAHLRGALGEIHHG